MGAPAPPEPPVFAGKVVIVTGASSGIGKALSLALAPQRPRLALAARDEARLQQVAEACRALGAESCVVPTDVASQDACQRLVTRTLGQFGAIDALVNNAGIGMLARLVIRPHTRSGTISSRIE